MQTGTVIFALLVTSAPCAADDKEAKPISPAEALKKVNEKITVEMTVKSTGKGEKGQMFFLNSEESYRDEKNFAIFIDAEAAKKFKEAKIEDPATFYKGKTIRVTGTVTTFREHPQIKVEKPEQIKVVEKK